MKQNYIKKKTWKEDMVEEKFNFAEVLTVKLFKIVDGNYSKPLANLRIKFL